VAHGVPTSWPEERKWSRSQSGAVRLSGRLSIEKLAELGEVGDCTERGICPGWEVGFDRSVDREWRKRGISTHSGMPPLERRGTTSFNGWPAETLHQSLGSD